MTTLHHIGELLRSGVRPTDEETEHLKALGGFVAEMYGRFMGGHAEHLQSPADLFSGKLSGRLSGATGARWEQGLGLAELLLGSELTSFWQIAREGFAEGYEGFDAERSLVDLYDEQTEAPVEAEPDASPRRRRGSLFGAKTKAPAGARQATRRGPSAGIRALLEKVGLTTAGQADASEPSGSGEPAATVQARWLDGTAAEMTVIRALAAGGLYVGDQVALAPASMKSQRGEMDRASSVQSAPARASTVQRAAAHVARGADVAPVFLDGVRIDARTPALASALARVDAHFGRSVESASGVARTSVPRVSGSETSSRVAVVPQQPTVGAFGAGAGQVVPAILGVASRPLSFELRRGPAAVSEARLGRLSSSPGYTLDRGIGSGERPIYGFFDAAETTYLNLIDETPAPAEAAEASSMARGRSVRSVRATRPVAAMPTSAKPARGSQQQKALEAVRGGGVRLSLDAVVPSSGGLRPFVGGVFAEPQETGVALASQVTHLPDGTQAVRVQRGGMSAPRFSIIEAMPFVAGVMTGASAAAGVTSIVGDGAQASSPVGASASGRPAANRLPLDVAFGALGPASASVEAGVGAPVQLRTAMRGSADAMVPAAALRQIAAQSSSVKAPIGGGLALQLGGVAQPAVSAGAGGAALVAGPMAQWRLAVDGGADMPLGATFSRHEVFAGTRASQSAGDVRATRAGFRSVIANDGEERPSELAQALDGMVWVTLPSEAAEPATAVDELGLAAVPSRRRAAMVPAGLALRTIASVSGQQRGAALARLATNVGETGGQPAAARGVAMAVFEHTLAGQPMVAREFEAMGTTAGGAERLAAMGPGSVGFDVAGFTQAMRAGYLGQVKAEAPMSAKAEVEPAQAIGSVSTATMEAVAARGASGRGSLAGRWIEAALRAEGFERGLRAARLLDGVVDKGGYARIESERQLLTIANETPAAPAQTEGEAVAMRGRAPRRGMGGRAALPGQVELRAARFSPASAAGRMTATGAAAQAVSDAQARGAARSGGTAQDPATFTTSVAARAADGRLGEGRVALSRAVMTARESRAVAAMLHAIGGVSGQGAATTVGSEAVTAAARQRGALGNVGVVGADEPVLGRLVQRMNDARGAQPIAARWEAPQSIVERVAGLGPAERREAARAFAAAGWSREELQMLRIEVPGAIDAASPEASVQATAPRTRRNVGGQAAARAAGLMPEVSGAPAAASLSGIAESSGARSSAGAFAAEQASGRVAVEAARTAQMSRSLARVLTGSESLAGPVDEAQAGVRAGAIAKSVAATWLPLLSTGTESAYFGNLAPTTRVSSLASLHDAVGDLVKLAETAVASSDAPVALAAQREVLRRMTNLKQGAAIAEGRTALGQPPALGQTALGQAGFVAQDEAARVFAMGDSDSTPLSSELGERASGVPGLVDTSAIKAFEQRIDVMEIADLGAKIREPQTMQLDEAERTMLRPERDAEVVGLEQRLAKALALSTNGPAGARRLLRSTAPVPPAKPTVDRRPTYLRNQRSEAQEIDETVSFGAAPRKAATVGAGSDFEKKWSLGAVHEEAQRTLSVMLGSVIAPEAMLNGLRSPELSSAIKALVVRRMQLGDDVVQVLTTLADSGVDLASARSSIAQARGSRPMQSKVSDLGIQIADLGKVKGSDVDAMLSGVADVRSATSSLATHAPEQEFLEIPSEIQDLAGIQVSSRQLQAMGKRARAGLLSAILRGTERAELTAILEQSGGRDFALAWLNRVDGSRSGIDIGMNDARIEFSKAFGVVKQRNSSIAIDSPIAGASLVDTSTRQDEAAMAGRGEDKSGLRSLAASMVHTSTGAARPQHGASQAVRRTDWSFVDTGSRQATPHADLGKLAAAIVGSAESSHRAPMPLVAPAAKAIAQTALRDDKNASAGTPASSGKGGGGGGAERSGDVKMSDKALEMLAVEMANRVARLMGLMNERRGIWS